MNKESILRRAGMAKVLMEISIELGTIHPRCFEDLQLRRKSLDFYVLNGELTKADLEIDSIYKLLTDCLE